MEVTGLGICAMLKACKGMENKERSKTMKEVRYIERSVNQGWWICWVALGHKTGAQAKAVALLGSS